MMIIKNKGTKRKYDLVIICTPHNLSKDYACLFLNKNVDILIEKPLGRNIDEMLRMIDALSHHQKHGEVCPAGWKDGDNAMAESPEGVSSYLSENAESL